MKLKTLDGIDVTGKRVLVRVDYNVPLKDGIIGDDTRVRRSLTTIRELLGKGASQIVLMSHLGKPKGVDDSLRMEPVAERLSQLLGSRVAAVGDCIDVDLPESRVVLLENLRFHEGETANDAAFAQKLSQHGDVFVNDAFGTCHRAHASVVGVTEYLPSYAGRLVQTEVEMLGGALDNPERPFIAILGCSKITDKIKVLENLLPKVDTLILGGAVVFTFLRAKGYETGRSLVEETQIDYAKQLMDSWADKLVFPEDIVVSPSSDGTGEVETVGVDAIPEGWIGLDLGERSVARLKEVLTPARTVLWNGPLGKYETDVFGRATEALAHFLAGQDTTTVVGGGDTAGAMDKYGVSDKLSHVSTGGGASLAFIEGKVLPGLQPLLFK
ncbi:MAG: phosphoglycerate kinase [Nanobdellota archaeon]